MRLEKNREKNTIKSPYSQFGKINGKHPLQTSAPDSYILYKARKRKNGKVSFFHFDLAKEMGLISTNHANELNPDLEKQILETFSLVIINEYDIENKRKFAKEDIKDNFYMATRYLQLQHPDQVGNSSGDGRSIWNGTIESNGVTWDISSCGSGATKLSPATSIYKKFFKTGDPTISYGCGYAELDEGLGTVLFSEIFHRNRIPTERVLAIIEFPGELAVTVRAYPNLIRPSHLFLHLKQSNLKALDQITEYYIQRQSDNGSWKNVPKRRKDRLLYFLDKVTDAFATTAAKFEDEYIFCWMDWDGDNILMDGGIIDYGSIRQFGLFHHEYRYDDDDRYSTNITEQKAKSRYIIQNFIQAVDYLLTGEKKSIKTFQKHPNLKRFDEIFSDCKDQNLLYKLGFNLKETNYLYKNHRAQVKAFRKVFSYFEMAKSKKGIEKTADGIICNAIFCMRDVLRELPQLLSVRKKILEPAEFIEVTKSSYATKNDLIENSYRNQKTQEFQKKYLKLVKAVVAISKKDESKTLLEMATRSSIINKYDRVTGDSVTCIVEEVMKVKPRMKPSSIFDLSKELSNYQDLNPEKKETPSRPKHALMKYIHEVIKELREGI
ncbi:MAG: YdiU family protein [Bdellovibrionales bacterium]|nr:YdiU family protein [Bdellovibrionales bacterium]